ADGKFVQLQIEGEVANLFYDVGIDQIGRIDQHVDVVLEGAERVREVLVGVVILARMGIDAQQIAIDIGLGDLRQREDRKGKDSEGDKPGKAQGCEADIFEAKANRALVENALIGTLQTRTKRHQNPTPPWAAIVPIFYGFVSIASSICDQAPNTA